jgi:hypothetical protein
MARGVFVAAAGAGAVAARRALPVRRGAVVRPRWHAITVNRPLDEVAPGGRLPGPLAELGDTVEVRMRPAPGDRGTEVAARLRDPGAGPGAGEVRRALRESRSLVETGEILLPDAPGTTRRTPLNRVLEHVTAHGREEGLL